MPEDNPPRRPTGASRARTGGTARRVDETTSRVPDDAPGAIPPSFSPGGGRGRPDPSDEAIRVGRPTRPTAPARQLAAPGLSTEQRLAAAQGLSAEQRLAAAPRPSPSPRPMLPERPSLTPSAPPRRPGSRRRRIGVVAAVVIVLLVAWPVGLLIWANGKIQHVDALSVAADTPGTTYLLAGSDSRAGGIIADTTTSGARADTIMLLQVPPSGPAALISLPRDTYVKIPGHGSNKLNASFSFGGAPLLVQTVEQLSGMHVDHYVEIGFGGIEHVVDAVGGVRLCLDPAVNRVSFPLNDADSGLIWDAAGCKVVDGTMSLAFARMRKADREGDIGRAKRQQQLISAVASTVAQPSLVIRPDRQVALISTGLDALQVSEKTNILDLGRLALAFRSATGPGGIKGTPPIRSANYQPGRVGSTVQLDPSTAPSFFASIMTGTLAPGPVGGMPAG